MADTEDINRLIEKIREGIEPLGLYMVGAHVQSSADEELVQQGDSIRSLIENGEEFVVTAHFQIGDLAWSDRILSPEAHAAEIEFQVAVPTEEEIMIEKILEAGRTGDLFDLDVSNEE